MSLALVAKRLAGGEPAFEAVSLIAEEIDDYHMVPGTGIEPARLAARSFTANVIGRSQQATTLELNCSRPFPAASRL